RSQPRGASVAVAGNPDRIAGDLGMEQVRQADLLARIALKGEIQHLIEIAVVDVAPPVDGDEVPAHHMREIGVEMRAAKQIEVAIELALGEEDRAEPLNGHVGERIEPAERNAVTLAE